MNVRAHVVRAMAFGLAAALASGCVGTPPTKYYTLSPVASPATDNGTRQKAATTIAVGPVTLPDYLDRPQIITRDSAYQLHLAAYDHWAAPLYETVPRVLVQDIAARLPNDRVLAFPQLGNTGFDYRVAVDVDRFDVDATGEATLAARWQVFGHSAPRALLVADDTLRHHAEGEKYASYASAMSAALAELSDRIAQAVMSVRQSATVPLAQRLPPP